MEIFSEIYSAYYNAVSEILSKKNLLKKDIEKIIKDNAFSESILYIMPQIKDVWNLLTENNKIYNSVLNNIPEMPLTILQKRWIKSVIMDSKARLFLEDDTISRLTDNLQDVKPLFLQNDFFFFDRFSDGDDYKNPDYISFFKIIHNAIKNKSILNITFNSSKGRKISHNFLPLKFEYSPKNNKFRVYTVNIINGKVNRTGIINISRIIDIKNTGKIYSEEIDIKKMILARRCQQPVCVEISSERNGIERFMMEFAGYEKRTEYNETTKKCNAYIWYNLFDETELLIRLLSFGPVLEIKSPEYFRNLAIERIKKQYEILHKCYEQN